VLTWVKDSESTGPARRCLCGLDGALLTSNKEGPNQGRKFWKCPKKEEEGRCKFFEWDDEPAKVGGGTSSSSGQGECFNVCSSGSASLCLFLTFDSVERLGTGRMVRNLISMFCVLTFSLACPNPSNSNKRAKTSDPKTSYRTDATCHTCGGKGHWANSEYKATKVSPYTDGTLQAVQNRSLSDLLPTEAVVEEGVDRVEANGVGGVDGRRHLTTNLSIFLDMIFPHKTHLSLHRETFSGLDSCPSVCKTSDQWQS